MAAYELGIETVTTVRFKLNTPTNGTELDKTLYAAAQHRREAQHRHDSTALDKSGDSLMVTVEDSAIVISYRRESY